MAKDWITDGIWQDRSAIDRVQVVALNPNHMVEKAPPPLSVMANTLPAGDPTWLEIDSTYPSQMQKRFELLATRKSWVIDRMSDPRVPAAEAELRDTVVSWLTTQHPSAFKKEEGIVSSALTGVRVDLKMADPLAAVAALASEDMLIMLPCERDTQKNLDVYRLMSGALLFPNGWSLRSQFDLPEPPAAHNKKWETWTHRKAESQIVARLGKSTYEIHHKRVPQYEVHFATGADRMLNSLPAGRTIWRRNWSPLMTDNLFRHADNWDDPLDFMHVSSASLQRRGHLRSEHETFIRLPQSRAMIFGIKTYVWPIADMLAEPSVFNALASAVKNATPETKAYQGRRYDVLANIVRKHERDLARKALQRNAGPVAG